MKPGFTLLELLIAVAVLGMLLVLLNQGVDFGLHATALQAHRQARSADLPAVDAALRRLIANADPGIYPEPSPFEGTGTSLVLLTLVPGPDGVPQPTDATLLVAAGQLRLRWTRHRHVERFGPAPPAQTLVLLDGVTAIQFDYFDRAKAVWQSVWQGDALPALVRLRLVFAQSDRHWPPLIVALPREALER